VQRLGGGRQVLAGHEGAPDRRALLPGLGRHLAHDLAHEQVELLRAGLGVEPEHRAVERVGLDVQPEVALHHRRVRAQQRAGPGRAGEAQQVLAVERVDQPLGPADEQLQRALGQQPGATMLRTTCSVRYAVWPAGLTMLGTPARNAGASFSSIPQTGKL
jgi:hypothetical protein